MGNLQKALTGLTLDKTTDLISGIEFSRLEEVASKVISHDLRTADDLAIALGVTTSEANALLGDDRFNKILVSKGVTQKKSLFVMKSLAKLDELVDHNDPNVAIKAIKEQANALGFTKKDETVVNISLENVLSRAKDEGVILDIKLPGLD